MPSIAILFGGLLCGLSVFTALLKGDGFQLGTWLIPAGFGIVLIFLGLISRASPKVRKHAMHTAALVGTIGALLCLVRGGQQIPKLMGDRAEEVNMLAFGMVCAMGVLCLTFVGTCVQSFIAARKAKEAGEARE